MLGTTGISSNGNSVPEKFTLNQNFPNPFNPVTKIKFSIPRSATKEGQVAKLIIYDILGHAVETLLNDELKPGSYEIEWDGTNYASGIYFYRLESGTFIDTKKMILVK